MANTADALSQAQRAFTAGDAALARRLAETVLASTPRSAAAWAVLANAANALGEFPAAAQALERLRGIQPDSPALRSAHALALNNSGSLQYRDGQLDAASALYRRALGIEPDNVLALKNLAACAERRRDNVEAAQCYERLVRIDARSVAAALGHARALRSLGASAKADGALDEAARRAHSVEERLEVAREYLRIGEAETAARLFDDETLYAEDAVAGIARLQALCNDTAGARARYARLGQRAATRGDERARFRFERDAAIALPSAPPDAQALSAARAQFAEALERLAADWPAQRLRQAGATLDHLACSRFMLGYQGADDRAIAQRYGDWLAAAAAALAPAATAQANERSIGRIGVVSARWTQGTIAAYFGSWIGALRAAGHEVYFFSLGDREDAVSSGLAAQATRAERLPGELSAAAARLSEARLDLLVYPEIGLDGRTEVLAALRLAPRQWAAWGHPVTTGLPTIERFVSVAAMEPPDAPAHYREPLALLPGLGTRYPRPPRTRGATRAQLQLPSGPLLALPHAALKLHPDSDALLVAIAGLEPDVRFVIADDAVPAISRAYRARIDTAMRRAGHDPARHLINLPPLPIDAFRAMLACVDAVVDSLYFSGGNTSLDALAQATPVVTIEGRFMRGRQTAAMLRLLDAPQTIARDVGEAAEIAAALIHSPQRRADLSATLAANAPRLFERDEPLQALCELVASDK